MGPVLYTVKVNNQTWKCHVEQLQESSIRPSAMEVMNDGAVAGSKWKDVPLAVTPTREGHPPEPESQRPIPEPKLIATCSGNKWSLAFYYCNCNLIALVQVLKYMYMYWQHGDTEHLTQVMF